MGAWIETRLNIFDTTIAVSRTLVGAWIETLLLLQWLAHVYGRTLVGAWIETRGTHYKIHECASHPCGCVD